MSLSIDERRAVNHTSKDLGMHHQPPTVLADGPYQCAHSLHAEMLRVEICSTRDVSFRIEAQDGSCDPIVSA
ncbi:hypothetical protein [Bradyrhizobium sp. 170]|uniref:hypothetical protein n=1 Tax=Bradyrhizobium sp. 170 TaxID=2782641 RepID=UPI001FFE4752|nr:hypothetical protein [Bradyrhizobium sp. 170]UPK05842.1 hypothetical protein IVB05_09925 [Bradyrhizobium sp. 170]